MVRFKMFKALTVTSLGSGVNKTVAQRNPSVVLVAATRAQWQTVSKPSPNIVHSSSNIIKVAKLPSMNQLLQGMGRS